MAQEMPIIFKEFIKFKDVGINPTIIRSNSLSFGYETSISVLDKIESKDAVVVVDITDTENPIMRQYFKDAALMNPSGEIIAMIGDKLELLHIERHEYEKIEKGLQGRIIFLKWINTKTLAIVTNEHVYLWDEGNLKWIYTPDAQVYSCQITDYKVCEGHPVHLLLGIPKEAGQQTSDAISQADRAMKRLHLHDVENGNYTYLDCAGADSGHVTIAGNRFPSSVICSARRRLSSFKLCFSQVGILENGEESYGRKCTDIILDVFDYPVDVKIIQKCGAVCLITYQGVISLYDMETTKLIYNTRIRDDAIFITSPKFDASGFLAVTETGKVYSIEIDEGSLIRHITTTLDNPALALRIAVRNDLDGAGELVKAEFDKLYRESKFEEAVKLAASSPKGILRTTGTIEMFRQIPIATDSFDPLLNYLLILLEHGRLDESESVELFTKIPNAHRNDNVINYIEKLSFSKKLGDLVDDFPFALYVYLRAGMPKKVADGIIERNVLKDDQRYKVASTCQDNSLLRHAIHNIKDIQDFTSLFEHVYLCSIAMVEQLFTYVPKERINEYIKYMVRENSSKNFPNCKYILDTNQPHLHTDFLINMFQEFKCFEGLVYVLESEVRTSKDAAIQLKFMQVACELGHIDKAKMVSRESNCNPFLADKLLQADLKHITRCCRFDYARHLAYYLLRNELFKYIIKYARVNPHRLPAVVEGLLDYFSVPSMTAATSMESKRVDELLMNMNRYFSIDNLISVVEERNKRGLLRLWLETRIREGCIDQAVHNTLAKIYIDGNNDPDKFLQENEYYDCKMIGKYCVDHGKPELACRAYERGYEILNSIDVKNQSDFVKVKTCQLIHLKCSRAWDKALAEDNVNRGRVVNAVVNSNMFGTTGEDEIKTTVLALQENNFLVENMQLLEKIIIKCPEISDKYDYETKLILTAINADSRKVMEYVHRFENFTVSEVGVSLWNAGLEKELLKLAEKFSIGSDAMCAILNKSSPRDKLEIFLKTNKDEFNKIFRRAQTYDCIKDMNCDDFSHLKDDNWRNRVCEWLGDLHNEGIFHKNSDYSDLRFVLENKARKDGDTCEKCFLQLFNGLKETCGLSIRFDDNSCCTDVAMAFNADLTHVLLVRKDDHIFTFPTANSIQNRGLQSILYEKMFDESFVKIESKQFVCYYLFGVIMWSLPKRSKYAWFKLNQLRNNACVDGVVVEVLEEIKGRGHLPLVLEEG